MSNQALVKACVLLMGELSPLDRADVNAAFAEHEQVAYVDYLPEHNAVVEEFLPISAGLTEPAADWSGYPSCPICLAEVAEPCQTVGGPRRFAHLSRMVKRDIAAREALDAHIRDAS